MAKRISVFKRGGVWYYYEKGVAKSLRTKDRREAVSALEQIQKEQQREHTNSVLRAKPSTLRPAAPLADVTGGDEEAGQAAAPAGQQLQVDPLSQVGSTAAPPSAKPADPNAPPPPPTLEEQATIQATANLICDMVVKGGPTVVKFMMPLVTKWIGRSRIAGDASPDSLAQFRVAFMPYALQMAAAGVSPLHLVIGAGVAVVFDMYAAGKDAPTETKTENDNGASGDGAHKERAAA